MTGHQQIRRMLPVLALLALGGCAINELNQDINARSARVDDKTRQLVPLEQRQRELAKEQARLLEDLRRKDMDAAQLLERLESMRAFNAAMAATTDYDRARKAELQRRLDQVASDARAVAAQNSAADSSSRAADRNQQAAAEKAKRQQIEALNERARKALEMTLNN